MVINMNEKKLVTLEQPRSSSPEWSKCRYGCKFRPHPARVVKIPIRGQVQAAFAGKNMWIAGYEIGSRLMSTGRLSEFVTPLKDAILEARGGVEPPSEALQASA